MSPRTDQSNQRLQPLQVALWAQLRSEVGRDNIEGGRKTLRAQKMPPKERRNCPDSKDRENQTDH